MNKIIYQGKEYADKVIIDTKIGIPFHARLAFLFRNKMTITQDVYTEYEMPPHKAVLHIHIVSFLDMFRNLFKKKNKYAAGEISAMMHAEIQKYVSECVGKGFGKNKIRKLVRQKYKVIIP